MYSNHQPLKYKDLYAEHRVKLQRLVLLDFTFTFPYPLNCYRQICLTTVVGLVPRSTCSQMGPIIAAIYTYYSSVFTSHTISL